jgi:hypothetical protein
MTDYNEEVKTYAGVDSDDEANLQVLISDLKALLIKQGFVYVYDSFDEAGAKYLVQAHKEQVSMYVVQGYFLLKDGAFEMPVYAGAEFKVPLKGMYTTEIGPEGCTYVIGEMITGDFVKAKF